MPSSKWEMNEWELQPQSPGQTQTELWGFAHPNPHHNDSNPHSQSRGDFPLWESKLLFLSVFVIFFWQVIFIHRLQEPDVGLRDCAAPASCFPADSRSTCPARSWTQPGEPGNCARSAQPGGATNREKPVTCLVLHRGHCSQELCCSWDRGANQVLDFWQLSEKKPQNLNIKMRVSVQKETAVGEQGLTHPGLL